MTRAYKVGTGIIALTLLIVVIVFVLVETHRSQTHSLSLVFERYSTRRDFFVQDVGFFWITNSSDKPYFLAMGATNTSLPDGLMGLGRYKEQSGDRDSYMVLCEFNNQKPQQLSWASLGKCLTLGPHSAVRLRVALPPEGQKRRVAVLCIEPPSGPRPFWTNSFGRSVLRTLPRSLQMKVMLGQPKVLKVWCDRELSHPAERPAKN